MSEQWLADFEDLGWAGPFDDVDAALNALTAGALAAGFERDDDRGELVHVPLARVGGRVWAGMPSSCARGPQRFLVELAYDPENEWGAPIGYDVHPLEERDGEVYVGPAVREIRAETHPDDGHIDGAYAEIARRAAAPIDERTFEEIGLVRMT